MRDLTHRTSPITRTHYHLRRTLDAAGIRSAETALPLQTADQAMAARELFGRFYDPGTQAFEHDGSRTARAAAALHSELDRLDLTDLQSFTRLDPVASAAALCNIAEALSHVEVAEDPETDEVSDETRATIRAALSGAVRKSTEEESEVVQAAVSLFGPEGEQLGRKDPESSKSLRRALSSGRLKRAVDLIGKFKRALTTARTRHVGSGAGEPFSVRPKRDIRSALPVELLQFANPQTRTLAFYKHQNAQTMCYERRSREKQQKGPFAIMLDASGSMTGERWEQAVTLALASMLMAHEQRREVRALVFNSTPSWIDCDLSSPASTMQTIQNLMSLSPTGGTDITRAFEAMQDVRLPRWQSPWVTSAARSSTDLRGMDLLLISDGRDSYFNDLCAAECLDEMEADLAYIVIGSEREVEPSLRDLSSTFWVGSDLLDDRAADSIGGIL